MYNARVLADSVSNPGGVRLTTLEVTFPRIMLSEFNTHRVFSRNSASSRAIPIEKQIERVRNNPFIPEVFGANQKGMQSEKDLNSKGQGVARRIWLLGIERAIHTAEQLADTGVHKQWANRVLEPYMWQTVIVSSTEWENFFKLRISEYAQPEIERAATLMQEALDASSPEGKASWEWHLPLVDESDIDEIEETYEEYAEDNQVRVTDLLRLVSAGRCARVSYLTHDGVRDLSADIGLAKRLINDKHMSPFEHVATPANYPDRFHGNFRGWQQFRYHLEQPNFIQSFSGR
jgi:thymidylate synthase ThyX